MPDGIRRGTEDVSRGTGEGPSSRLPNGTTYTDLEKMLKTLQEENDGEEISLVPTTTPRRRLRLHLWFTPVPSQFTMSKSLDKFVDRPMEIISENDVPEAAAHFKNLRVWPKEDPLAMVYVQTIDQVRGITEHSGDSLFGDRQKITQIPSSNENETLE